MAQAITIDRTIYDVMPQFMRIASKRNAVTWEEESQYALQICKANPSLIKCEISTIQDAIINVASVGLTLNPSCGYAYLVPEFNKNAQLPSCQLRISFKGLIKLAVDSGSIAWVKADVVKDKDTFEYRGINNIPLHHMDPFSDRGETKGVYCVAKTLNDELLVEIMDREQIDRIRACAKTKNVWDQWPDEMAKKAIIKRAAKQWPPGKYAKQLSEAIAIVNKSEGSDFGEFEQLEKTASYIIDAIGRDDAWGVGEAWCECTEQQQSQLWRAITKGGYFTQDQKSVIRKACAEYRKENANKGRK